MITVDGNKIAENILKEIQSDAKDLGLAVVQVGDNKVSSLFIKKKREVAEKMGVNFKLFQFPIDISTNALRKEIKNIKDKKNINGILVQLPLPEKTNTQYILDSIPFEKDIDMLSSLAVGRFITGKTKTSPPVTTATLKILDSHNIKIESKVVVIVGAGRLVGRPLMHAFLKRGATVIVLNAFTKDISSFTKMADILISGTGNPGLITGNMIKKGVVLVDAGLSVKKLQSGKLSFEGDVNCGKSSKIKLLVPAIGGIGPITVAMVINNLLILAKKIK